MKIILLYLLLIVTLQSTLGQGFYNRNAWKNKRVELTGGLGASNFLGELGGRDRIGSKFLWDLEFVKTRYVAQFTYQYYIAEKIAIRPSFHFARVSGDDKLTQERFRNHRNLNFTSNLYELSFTGEYQFVKEKIGNIYGIKTSTGKKLGLKSMAVGTFVSAGVGLVFFNPKSIGPNGAKVALRNLGTEGQGLSGGGKMYKRYTIAVPLGVGFRKSLNRTSGIKVEFNYRFTFSDYIDDVSTNYYDNSLLQNARGDVAAFVADPSPKDDDLNNTGAGLQRGDPTDRDNYLFLTFSYYKKISKKASRSKYGRKR